MLSPEQLQAAKEVISGRDTFVSLHIGYRESLIYQFPIPSAKELAVTDGYQRPLLLVVAPLHAVVADEIRYSGAFGLSCLKLETDPVDDCLVDMK